MNDDDLEITIRLKELAQFVRDTERARRSVKGVGDETDTVGKRSKETTKHTNGLASSFKRLMLATTAYIGVSKGLSFMMSTVDSASNLNEEISKTKTIFGASSKSVLAWGETTANAMGISNRAALAAAGNFGAMMRPMGVTTKKSAEMSKSLVNLAGDLASFYNANPEDALQALRSGLSGEAEPLRRFGVFLTDAKLKQQALTMGLYDGKGALEGQAKMMAAYAIIMKETTLAQGDAKKTGNQLAGSQRRMAANIEDLKAAIGKKLMPVMRDFYGWVNRFIVQMKTGQGAGGLFRSAIETITNAILRAISITQTIISKVQQFTAALQSGNPAAVLLAGTLGILLTTFTAFMVLTKIIALAKSLRIAWIGVNVAMAANPIVLVIAAIVGLGVILVLAYKKIGWFRDGVKAAWSAIKNAVVNAVRYMIDKISTFLGWLKAMPGKVADVGIGLGKAIANGVISALNHVINGINSMLRIEIDPPGPGKVTVDAPDIPQIPPLAMGGHIISAGTVLVGEQGPELLTLPTGATVTPLAPQDYSFDPVDSRNSRPLEITLVNKMDGKEISRSVFRVVGDELARR